MPFDPPEPTFRLIGFNAPAFAPSCFAPDIVYRVFDGVRVQKREMEFLGASERLQGNQILPSPASSSSLLNPSSAQRQHADVELEWPESGSKRPTSRLLTLAARASMMSFLTSSPDFPAEYESSLVSPLPFLVTQGRLTAILRPSKREKTLALPPRRWHLT